MAATDGPVELEGLSYRELQSRCRESGLRATGKAEELLQRLLDHAAGVLPASPPPTTVRKASRARADSGGAKTPRTTRKAAAATPVVDKAALLRAAASTPLPARQQPAESGDEADEEAEEPQRGSARRRQSASQSKQPRRSSSGGSQRPSRRKASTAGLATPLFWSMLLLALTAALAALAVPYCQQRDCKELARNLPELTAEAASEAYGAARGHALAAADVLQERWQELLAALTHGKSGGARPPACEFDAPAALHAIMPEGEEYSALKVTAGQLLGSKGSEPADKAAVALFVCEAEADCHSAVRELDGAAADSQRCVLHLDGRHLGGDKGALQTQLADFLRAVPTGVVVLRRIDQMSPDLLPVLINALSEQGAFQQDGMPVHTTEATFMLTSLMPGEVFGYLEEEIKFKQEAKTHMVVDFAMRAADKETAKSQASALRRRIDLVIPIGSDPFEFDQQQEVEGEEVEAAQPYEEVAEQ